MNSAHFPLPSFGSAARGPALGLEFPAHIFGLERAGQALCGDADGLFDECASRLAGYAQSGTLPMPHRLR